MLESRDISPRVGAEIRVDKKELVAGTFAADIVRLLKDRIVLVFPQMGLSKDEQFAFARTLGEVAPMGGEGVANISLNPKVSPFADYTLSSFFWHIDGAKDVIPCKATILTAKILPDEGGDTFFCNNYAAYGDLPPEDKALVNDLRACHSIEATQRMIMPQPSVAELKRWRGHPSRSHPLVWRHRDGRTSLFIGATAHYVEGMSLEEGTMLLCRLQEWSIQEQYVYRHKWTEGDLLMWNCGIMHRVDHYPRDRERLMHRTTLRGEEPVSNAA
jgi:alpha-ketoglutarate-dependent taurine dioxygenase